MAKRPTKRQREILKYIHRYLDQYGYPPSVRDIAGLHSCSVKGAYDHILALERHGLISRTPKLSRSITITDDGLELLKPQDSRRIPIVGRIAAGEPIWAEENIEGYTDFRLEAWERKSYRFFALKIIGDSMRDAGILDGDIGIFRYQRNAEPGSIVVALVENEATVKFYYREGNRVILRAANEAYPDMILPNVEIQGVLRGLIRPEISR